jgi:tetratricopeptide (TPR) repeat protein
MGGLDLAAIRFPAELVVGMKAHYAGRWDEATDVYTDILTRDPGHAEAQFMLAMIGVQVGEWEHAETLMRGVCRQRPAWMLPPFNLGVIYDALGRPDHAMVCYQQALALRPDFTSALVNLGNSFLGRGDLEGAIGTWERALGADRDSDSEARLNISFALILQGKWELGWAEYEHRTGIPGHLAANPMPAGIPIWQGEDLTGKTILVQEEQGMGDTIMLMRYDAALYGLGVDWTAWRVPRVLVALLQSFGVNAYGDDESIGAEEFDYCIASYSLPYRFGTRPETVPPQPEFVG